MSTLLIRMTQPPYSTSSSSDGLDFALSATNYGHEVIMVFEGEGIFQLLPQQMPVTKSIRNHSKRIKALPLFDIDACYYVEEDLTLWGLTAKELSDVAKPCSHEALRALLVQCEHVVSF